MSENLTGMTFSKRDDRDDMKQTVTNEEKTGIQKIAPIMGRYRFVCQNNKTKLMVS